jgi:Leucine-rich repeat (LRR) protein
MTVSGIPVAIINDGLEDIDVEMGSTCTLDATSSFDPDGTIESYFWSQSSEGTQVEFSSENESIVTFTVPTEENDDVVCIVSLTVTDNDGNTDMTQLTITGVEDVDCFAEDGTEGIEIWGNCYSIENTLSLELSNSGIDGEISPEIGRLINLTYLNLENNQLSGEIPSEIGNLINLNSLFLTSNQLSGDIPESMENMTNLFSLWLSDNQLSGMPSNICSWPSYINGYLLLSSNQFCPPYLECIEQNLGIQDCSQGIPPVSVINDGSLGMTATMGSQITLDGSASYDLDGTIIDYSWSQLPFADQGIFNLTNESIVTFTVPSNIDIDTVQSDIPIGCIIQLTVTDDVGNAHMSQLVIEVTDDELGLSDASNTPDKFRLSQNYPNPFNPVTTLQYNLPEDGLVNITVYDMLGNVVNNLVNTYQSPGYKSVQWNATDNKGQPVSAGVYLYSIESGDFRQTKKMILLK